MKQDNRRSRSDAVQTQVAAHKNGSAFVWPERMDLPNDEKKARNALAIADDVFSTRAPQDWRDSDDSLIAEYAMVSADLESMQVQLSDTGYFTRMYGRGGKQMIVASPIAEMAHRLSARRSKLAGVLALTSTAGLGDTRTIAKNGQLHRESNPRAKVTGIIDLKEILG